MAPKSRPKRARRTYTQKQRDEAVELYRTDGTSAASKQTGIPKNTIQDWARKAGVRTVRNKKTEAATKASEIDSAAVRAEVAKLAIDGSRKAALLLLKRLDHDEENINTRDLGTIFGILTDKHVTISRANEGSEQHNAVDAWLNHITGGVE